MTEWAKLSGTNKNKASFIILGAVACRKKGLKDSLQNIFSWAGGNQKLQTEESAASKRENRILFTDICSTQSVGERKGGSEGRWSATNLIQKGRKKIRKKKGN